LRNLFFVSFKQCLDLRSLSIPINLCGADLTRLCNDYAALRVNWTFALCVVLVYSQLAMYVVRALFSGDVPLFVL
jgi:hypothetical protein